MHNAVMGTGDTIGAYGAPAGGGVPLDFVELLPQVVFETDAAGIILYVNRIASELSGYSMDELRSGKNILSFLTPECREIAVTNMTEVMAGRRPRTAEYTIIRKDGSTFPVNIYSTAIIRDGNFAGLRGIIVDITDQKQTESALSQSEARFQTLIHNLPYGIVLIAPDGSPEYLNPTFTRLFGYTPADIPSAQAWFERAYPDPVYHASMMALWDDTDATATVAATAECIVRCKDGSDKTVQFHRVNIDGGRTILTCIDMTARVKAEEALRESEYRHKIITELTSDYVFVLDVDEHGSVRMEFITENYPAITGRSADEVRTPDSWDSILHPDDRDRVMRLLAETIATGTTVQLECRTFLKSGVIRWVHIDARPLPGSSGRVRSIVGAVRDITERKSVEEALRESKHELDFITGNMIDLIAHAGPDGRYQYTSPSYQTVLGYSETELRAMSGFDIVHPDDIQRIWATYIEAIINREPRIRYETRLRRADGEFLPFEVTAKILYDDAGRLAGGILSARNLTERRAAERALRESEEKYRAIFAHTSEGIFQSTTSGRYLTVNPALADMYGFSGPSELLREVTDIAAQIYADPADRSRFIELLEQHGAVTNMEMRMRRRDGSIFWVSTNARAVRDAGGAIAYYEGTSQDITERKQSRERIQDALREKEVLLREVHHRVKNNFQIISSLMNLQRQRIADAGLRSHYGDAINRIAAMAAVHERLYRSADLSRVDLADYIADIAAELMTGFRRPDRPVALHCDTTPVTVPVEIAIPCALIINEALTNSLKHAFPPDWRGDPEIRITLRRRGPGEVELALADNGVGIPDQPPGPAQSLGLQIIPLLARQINGRHSIERGDGACHRIVFANIPAAAR